ncbi:PIH1 domain-containing protein 1 [Galendromus occidentalis]|uniref:PIH1 domain-containing protein 1 n=1 Tax=Galendromus occidentalis TaxID=34638 RepID=A0AAJ7WIS1_9ACAR|nr:PIH1 domain-containing protein 1 [Galendromus occidentalis]
MAFLEVPSSPSSEPTSLSNIVAEDETHREFRELLESAAENAANETSSIAVRPSKGFCVKFKRVDEAHKKAFINICHTSEIPAPIDISESELTSLLESESAASYRVPLSLGVPHDELDKKGEPCTAYDVIINSNFYQKCLSAIVFKEFVTLLAAQGIEDKYSIVLSRTDYVTLQNRKYLGSMPQHYIRDRGTTKPTPLIDEVETPKREERVAEPMPRKAPPNVRLNRVQKPGRCVEHLVAEIEIPHMTKPNEVNLDMAKDRILVQRATAVKPEVDVYLPLELDVDNVKAQYDHKTRLLRIDAPILKVQ